MTMLYRAVTDVTDGTDISISRCTYVIRYSMRHEKLSRPLVAIDLMDDNEQ